MRAVIDTNVVISAMRSTRVASHAILMAIHQRRFTPVLSVPLLMEYEEVAKRPGMLPHLSQRDIDEILDQICSRSVEQRIYFQWRPFFASSAPGIEVLEPMDFFACHPRMSMITIQIPDSLRRQVERLAAEDQITVDQFFASAAFEKLAAWPYHDGKWIHSDPLAGKVIVGHALRNEISWFNSRVTMHRWMVLE